MVDQRSEALERLEEQRRSLEAKVSDLRQAITRETGWTPGNAWLVPILGFAGGLALAMMVKSRRGGSPSRTSSLDV